MKEYTKEEIYPKLFTGKKYRAIGWEATAYIEVKDGQIIDMDGNKFDLPNSSETDWVLWTKPKPKPKKKVITISKDEAISALFQGKRIKASSWKDKQLFMQDGQIMLNDSEIFDITNAKETDWEIIKDDAPVDTTNFEELQKIHTMLSDIKSIVSKEESKVTTEPKSTDGRSKEEKNNTTGLLKNIYGVTTPGEIEKQFKERLDNANNTKDIEKAVCEYIPYCWLGGRALGTTSGYYTNMRKVIKELDNEGYRETALSLFLPPQSLYETVQEKVSDNKKNVIRERKTFEKKKIEETITKIKNKILLDNYSDRHHQTSEEREKAYWAYAYLTLVTGRRQSEILRTLQILKNKKKKDWEYCGILKDREDGKCIKAYSLEPDYELLSDLADFVQQHITEEINQIIEKKRKDGMEEEEIEKRYKTNKILNSKFNNPFNNALERITGTALTSSDWRDIFAEMMWVNEGNKKGSYIDRRDFKAQIFGHAYNSNLSPTEHYDAWEAV